MSPRLIIGLVIFVIIFLIGGLVLALSLGSSKPATQNNPPADGGLQVGGGINTDGGSQTGGESGAERPDYRCGPEYGNAKCGPGRCCSRFGWCGSAGEPHCTRAMNSPDYNGSGAVIV